MGLKLSRREILRVGGGGALLLLSGGVLLRSRLALAAETNQADAISRIGEVAAGCAIASYHWADRGQAPAGYIKGVAVSYAKVSYDLSNGNANALEMAKGVTADASRDALKYYEDVFKQAGMDNTKDGEETLRHLFVLMLGLGMRESSGRYCEGRDRSAENTTAETAEAGVFQTSFNARRANPLMPKLFKEFVANPVPSYLEVFKEGVRARDADLENFGAGDGRDFQKCSKECPFFAVEFAGIGLRNIRKHWGPINRRDAEVRGEADEMFQEVRRVVEEGKLGAVL